MSIVLRRIKIRFNRITTQDLQKIIAVMMVLGSLFTEYILLWTPCYLCWWQRIFWYPLAISLLILPSKECKKKMVNFLAIPGAIIAFYHYTVQMFSAPLLSTCTSQSVRCDVPHIKLLGFITMPFLSFVFFVIILLLNKRIK